MISVDIEELERLADRITMVATKSDDSVEKLRRVLNEMLNDVELLTYPQGPLVNDTVSYCLTAFSQANDTLQSLRTVLITLAELYKVKETEFSNDIFRMAAFIDSLSVSANASVVSSSIPNIEVSDGMQSQSNIQALVDESVLNMQITNIAAVNKTIEDDYDIDEVKPVSNIQEQVEASTLDMQFTNTSAASKTGEEDDTDEAATTEEN